MQYENIFFQKNDMIRHTVEVEIKSFLGSAENANALKGRIRLFDPCVRLAETSKQRNHYFIGGRMDCLQEKIGSLLKNEKQEQFFKIAREGKNVSLRTRETPDAVFFVAKASIDDTTSENGTARMECEAEVSLTLDELDRTLLDCGCAYQAKWSRDREEYVLSDETRVCIDRNAGYGYLAEFERVVVEGADAEAVKMDLRNLMKTLSAEELPQDRLERMFAFYNEHWQEYYGTEKTFVVE